MNGLDVLLGWPHHHQQAQPRAHAARPSLPRQVQPSGCCSSSFCWDGLHVAFHSPAVNAATSCVPVKSSARCMHCRTHSLKAK